MTKKYKSPEEDVQKAFVNYLKLQYPNVLYCASLGGIRTSIKQAKKAKATGYIKGFPDMQIMHPNKTYHGLFIEIKPHKKAYASIHQKDWIEKLNSKNYFAKVCKGLDDCIETADWYLKLP
tara:strand:+ start:1390 stop:1752 length:363 start_codon:yes stop_codon:yes gene_type:complete